MKALREQFERLERVPALRQFRTIIETIGGIVLGPTEVTPGAPHVRDNIEIKRYMSFAIIALLPSTISAIVFFGWRVLLVIAVCYVAGGIVEVAFAMIRKRHIEEGFLVTGLIFPLVLPPSVPLWVAAVGVAVGVFFGKEVFGGTGRNIFNPALVGRLFITVAFPQIMSSQWTMPYTDTITSATPLANFKIEGHTTPYLNLLMGHVPGSMGEVFRIGIIIGGLFLMATRVSNWRIPITYIVSAFVFGFLGHLLDPQKVAPALMQVLSGGLLFGAMFMATDPVTSPYNQGARYVCGVMLGLLTVVIRSFSGYTEGVMFSIIFMNALNPLIDHLVLRTKYRTARR